MVLHASFDRKHVGAEISVSMYECKQVKHKGGEKRYTRISACTGNVSTGVTGRISIPLCDMSGLETAL